MVKNEENEFAHCHVFDKMEVKINLSLYILFTYTLYISYTLVFLYILFLEIFNYQVSFIVLFIQLSDTENAFKYPVKTRL